VILGDDSCERIQCRCESILCSGIGPVVIVGHRDSVELATLSFPEQHTGRVFPVIAGSVYLGPEIFDRGAAGAALGDEML